MNTSRWLAGQFFQRHLQRLQQQGAGVGVFRAALGRGQQQVEAVFLAVLVGHVVQRHFLFLAEAVDDAVARHPNSQALTCSIGSGRR